MRAESNCGLQVRGRVSKEEYKNSEFPQTLETEIQTSLERTWQPLKLSGD